MIKIIKAMLAPFVLIMFILVKTYSDQLHIHILEEFREWWRNPVYTWQAWWEVESQHSEWKEW